jgi:uncharacterized protein YhbP (UPF0306 family)
MMLTNITAQNVAGMRLDKPLTEEQVRRVVFDILEDNTVCSMGTVTPDGLAHLNTVYFCYSDELELYFLSHTRSTHSRNLATNSSLAVAIYAPNQQWLGPDRGLQLFGTGIQAEDTEASKAEELYTKRFSAYKNWKDAHSDEFNSGYRFYRFVVLRLKVLDEANLREALFVTAVVHRK